MPGKREGYCGFLGVDPSFDHPERGIVREMRSEQAAERLRKAHKEKEELIKNRINELGLENCGPGNFVEIKFEQKGGGTLSLQVVGIEQPSGNLILQYPDGRRYRKKVGVLSKAISIVKK